MRERWVPDYDVVDLPEEEPIVFSGRPRALRGLVRFYNPGEGKVVLRDMRVRSEAKEVAAGRAGELAQTLPTIILRPGQSRERLVSLALSPHTPPGEYRAELEIAGRRRPVLLQVAETVRLDVEPARLVIENRPDEVVTKRVIFSNGGNVPLTIGEIRAVPLDEELLICRAGRAALAEVGDEVDSVDELAVAVVRQINAILKQTGVLRVHNTAGTVELPPGAVQPVDLEIRVPAKLERRSRYFGSAAIYTTNLEFVVVPVGGASTEGPRTTRRGRRQRGGEQ